MNKNKLYGHCTKQKIQIHVTFKALFPEGPPPMKNASEVVKQDTAITSKTSLEFMVSLDFCSAPSESFPRVIVFV